MDNTSAQTLPLDAQTPSAVKAMSRTAINVVLVAYLILGIAIGWFWRAGRSTAIDEYHAWLHRYVLSNMLVNIYWLGTPVMKLPLDLWVYQEIITETKPDVLIETGTYKGGSASFFASIFDFVKHGRVLSIDIKKYPNLPQNPRITYFLGSSTSEDVVQQIRNSIRPGERVMVSLDADHRKAYVLKELQLYSQVVTVGNYLVVEDTERRVDPVSGPGPMPAVDEFLKSNHNFVQDRSREKFGITCFPGGWLKRVK